VWRTQRGWGALEKLAEHITEEVCKTGIAFVHHEAEDGLRMMQIADRLLLPPTDEMS
jgi:hypothetical protein